MAERDFRELFTSQNSVQNHVCIGLDTDIDEVIKRVEKGLNLPLHAHATDGEMVLAYNKMVLEATSDIPAAYKPNLAFYSRLGEEGRPILRRTVQMIKEIAPGVVIILDAKYGDIDNTNKGYAYEAFDYLGVDAVTVHNFMGMEAMRPFLDQVHKGIFVLVKTSNKGSGEFQNLGTTSSEKNPDQYLDGSLILRKLYEIIANGVARQWNYNGNCGIVAGGTYLKEAKDVREIVGSTLPLLIPGVGAQGGEAKDVVPLALRKGQLGIINSSRKVVFAKPLDGEIFQDAIRREAQTLHQEIVNAQNG